MDIWYFYIHSFIRMYVYSEHIWRRTTMYACIYIYIHIHIYKYILYSHMCKSKHRRTYVYLNKQTKYLHI